MLTSILEQLLSWSPLPPSALLGGVPVLAALAGAGRTGDDGAREAEDVASPAGEPGERLRGVASEQLARAVLESLGDGLVVYDADFRIVYWNPRMERITALEASDVVGRRGSDLFPHLGTAAARALFEAALAGEVVTSEDTHYTVPDTGRHGWVVRRYAPIRSNDDVVGVVGIVYDVTVRRLAEDALRESEAKYRALVEQASDGILICRPDGTILEANPRLTEMLGRPRSAMVGRHLDEFVMHGDGAAPEEALGMGELRVGQTIRRACRLERRTGEAAVCEMSARKLDDGRIFAIVRDMTEERRVEDRLRQTQKLEAVGQLAGGVAHDFNNLLTAVLGNVGLIEAGLSAGAPTREIEADLAEVRMAAERAASLTQQILAFARRQVLRPARIDANELVLHVERMLARLLGEDVLLETVLEPDAGWVRVDRNQLAQVLVNLCLNARDAMPRGGRITISTEAVHLAEQRGDVAPGGYVRIRVADTGTGMDAATAARAFEPFFSTRTAHSGLGLSTSYGIVTQSGGRMTIESEPGGGTTVEIWLPREEQTSEERMGTGGGESGSGVRVLLVEDADAVRAVARRILERYGYDVTEAASAEEAEALALGAPEPPDLLVTDLVLPGRSGRELAERLKESQPELRVLYTSGYTDDMAVRRGIQEGVHHFLQKPFTPDALARAVREALGGG